MYSPILSLKARVCIAHGQIYKLLPYLVHIILIDNNLLHILVVK